jgi:hypothetical protein
MLSNTGAKVRALLIIFGIAFLLFGSLVSLGAAVAIIEGTYKPLPTKVAALVLGVGITLFGLFMIGAGSDKVVKPVGGQIELKMRWWFVPYVLATIAYLGAILILLPISNVSKPKISSNPWLVAANFALMLVGLWLCSRLVLRNWRRAKRTLRADNTGIAARTDSGTVLLHWDQISACVEESTGEGKKVEKKVKILGKNDQVLLELDESWYSPGPVSDEDFDQFVNFVKQELTLMAGVEALKQNV